MNILVKKGGVINFLISVLLIISFTTSVIQTYSQSVEFAITNDRAGNNWGYVGDSTFTNLGAVHTVSPDGVEYRAFRNRDEFYGGVNYGVTVQKHENGEWQNLGPNAVFTGVPRDLKIDNNGDLVVLGIATVDPIVYKYSSTSQQWNQLGSDLDADVFFVEDLDLEINSNNEYFVALVGNASNQEGRVYRWDDPNWTRIAGFNGADRELDFEINTQDEMFLAMRLGNNSSTPALLVQKYVSDNNWQNITPSGSPQYQNITMEIDSSDEIKLITSTDFTSTTPLVLRTYNGANWTVINDPSFPTTFRNYDFYIDENNNAFIAGQDETNNPVIYRKSTADWEKITSSSFEESDLELANIEVVNDSPRLLIEDLSTGVNNLISIIKYQDTALSQMYTGQNNITTIRTNSDATFEIVGGADSEFFDIDTQTGEVTFIDAKTFLNKQDENINNIYEVEITATDTTTSDTDGIFLKVEIIPDPGIGIESPSSPWDDMGDTQPFKTSTQFGLFDVFPYQDSVGVAYIEFDNTNKLLGLQQYNGDEFVNLPITTNNADFQSFGTLRSKEVDNQIYIIGIENTSSSGGIIDTDLSPQNFTSSNIEIGVYDSTTQEVSVVDTSVLGDADVDSIRLLTSDNLQIGFREQTTNDFVVHSFDTTTENWTEEVRATTANLANIASPRHYNVNVNNDVYYFAFRDSQDDLLSVIAIDQGNLYTVGTRSFTQNTHDYNTAPSIAFDSNNTIYVTTNGGSIDSFLLQVYKFENNTWENISNNGVRSDFTRNGRQLFVDENDTLYLKTDGNTFERVPIVYRYIPGQGWQDYGSIENNEIPSGNESLLTLGNEGELYLVIGGEENCEGTCQLFGKFKEVEEISVQTPEGQTRVETIQDSSNNTSGFSFEVTGGVDGDKFTTNSNGEIEFIAAPDFETPQDTDNDNIYEIEVALTQTDLNYTSDTAIVVIEVTDIDEQTQNSDSDNVLDIIELGAPNNGDGNNDGTLDSTQSNVASLPGLNGDYITVVTDGCDISTIEIIAEQDLPQLDESFEYPNGLVDFTAPCPQADVTIFFYNGEGLELRKYNDLYLDLSELSEVTISTIDTSTVRVEYTLTDGGLLDYSDSTDNIVRDPIGVGVNEIDPEAQLIRTGGY